MQTTHHAKTPQKHAPAPSHTYATPPTRAPMCIQYLWWCALRHWQCPPHQLHVLAVQAIVSKRAAVFVVVQLLQALHAAQGCCC